MDKLDDLNAPRERPVWVRLVPDRRLTIHRPSPDIRRFLNQCSEGVALIVKANHRGDFNIELARGEREDQWINARVKRLKQKEAEADEFSQDHNA